MAEVVYLENTFITIFSQPVRGTKSNPYEMIFYGELTSTLTLYSQISLCIFSILFSIHFLWHQQGVFV